MVACQPLVAVVVGVAEDHPQLLPLLLMAMVDQMGASRAILPLSSMEIDPKVNNS